MGEKDLRLTLIFKEHKTKILLFAIEEDAVLPLMFQYQLIAILDDTHFLYRLGNNIATIELPQIIITLFVERKL